MTQPKHTPGPWRWDTGHRRDAEEADALDPGVIEYAGCGSHAVLVSPENRALIEASPDLFASIDLYLNSAHSPKQMAKAREMMREARKKVWGQ